MRSSGPERLGFACRYSVIPRLPRLDIPRPRHVAQVGTWCPGIAHGAQRRDRVTAAIIDRGETMIIACRHRDGQAATTCPRRSPAPHARVARTVRFVRALAPRRDLEDSAQ